MEWLTEAIMNCAFIMISVSYSVSRKELPLFFFDRVPFVRDLSRAKVMQQGSHRNRVPSVKDLDALSAL